MREVLLCLEAVATCNYAVCLQRAGGSCCIPLPIHWMLTLYSPPMCTLSHFRLLQGPGPAGQELPVQCAAGGRPALPGHARPPLGRPARGYQGGRVEAQQPVCPQCAVHMHHYMYSCPALLKRCGWLCAAFPHLICSVYSVLPCPDLPLPSPGLLHAGCQLPSVRPAQAGAAQVRGGCGRDCGPGAEGGEDGGGEWGSWLLRWGAWQDSKAHELT